MISTVDSAWRVGVADGRRVRNAPEEPGGYGGTERDDACVEESGQDYGAVGFGAAACGGGGRGWGCFEGGDWRYGRVSEMFRGEGSGVRSLHRRICWYT